MRSTFLLAIVVVFGLINVNAQKNLEFGIKGGLNVATITGASSEDSGYIIDLHFGVLAELSLSDKFSFQSELIYSLQGPAPIQNQDNQAAGLEYLNLPLMGKYYIAKGFSLEIGPQIGFLLSAKNDDTDASINVKDLYKTLDFGVNFGLGYKLDNGLHFGVRYNLGLSNINDDNGFSDKYRNSVFQLSIGYFFTKKK
ncbi:porin family protein [uncultured Winogradskyella sp.]|uniref:porin family protein n=1 Tax=uncultured Winogradskyella sp. TaxID=395353 RepID=UPI00261AF675|nr:porin family protein [uncultured Winogradskyella sp.]